jgi:hypothetical protein
LARNPDSLRWRQALPAGFVFLLLALSILALVLPSTRVILASYVGVYLSITFGFGLVEAMQKRDPGLGIGFSIALWTMHLAWGSAFIGGIIVWSLRRLRGGK